MTTQLQQCREVAAALEEECMRHREREADWREHRAAANKALYDMPTVLENYRRALAVALLLLALMACGGNGGDDKPPVCTGNNRPVCALPTSPPEYHGWACPHVDVDAPCIPLPPTPPVTPEATE